MRVRVATTVDREAWDKYVSSCPHARLYHLFDWGAIFEALFACKPFYLIAETGTDIVGVLPLLCVKNVGFTGNYVASLPGGLCTHDDTFSQQLLNQAIDLTRKHRMGYLALRDGEKQWDDSRLITHTEYTYVLDNLPANPDLVWKKIRAEARTRVRKARKHALTTAWNSAPLDAFYRAYATNMRDLGTPAMPKRFFAYAMERFPDTIHLLTVHSENTVIGGMMLFAFNGVLYNPFVSSLRAYFDLCPNDLLYWEAIVYACEHGYRMFDMGRSPAGSGHARFKQKYGAQPRPLFYQYYLNTKQTAPAMRGGKLYDTVSRVWKRLPLYMTDHLGPVIRYFIPFG